MSTGLVSGVRVSHERARVEDLEAAAVGSQRHAVEDLLSAPPVREAFVVQTCNRVEAYVVGEDERAATALEPVVAAVPPDAVVSMDHEASLRHLLRVAAGLESVVLGEDQVLGQLRDAYEDARSVGGVGPVLEDALTKALHVGERARTETHINDGTLSLAHAAVRLASRACDLSTETGLVVGAGEMGRLAAQALAGEVDRLLVANRTVPHAEHVAETVDVEASAVALDALPAVLAQARVVVTATDSPDPVVDPAALTGVGETFVVDIAQPRDVPPDATWPQVTVRDLDDLEAVTRETRAERREAADAVETMVEAEFDRLLAQYKRKRAEGAISTMYESAERVKAQELETALEKLDLSADQASVVGDMADAIVAQLLATPTESLRDAAEQDDWETIHAALDLFDPNVGSADADDPGPRTERSSTEDGPGEVPAETFEQQSDD